METKRLLEKALNIIIGLEEFAGEQMKKDIEALFQEVQYGDNIDEEMRNYDADAEAQDFFKFGKGKI